MSFVVVVVTTNMMEFESDLVVAVLTQAQIDLVDPPKLYVPQVVFAPLFMWLHMRTPYY